MERFLRSVRVTVGDGDAAIRIEDLFISFRIRRESTSTPAEGHIDIYNLNESNETRIRERGRRVRLEAGYGGVYDLIFDGDVRRVERQRVDLDRVTRIHVGGNVEKQTRSIFNRTYEGEVSIRDIVRDGVEVLELELGPVDLIPEDAVENDFKYNGPTRLMLDKRLEPLGIQWYEEDGVVKFSKIKITADDRPMGVTISERTGMIGTPTVTDDGIRVHTLLDHRLKLDTRIRVVSSVLQDAASGDSINERALESEDTFWKVVAIVHDGDNREGEFATTVEGRPID